MSSWYHNEKLTALVYRKFVNGKYSNNVNDTRFEIVRKEMKNRDATSTILGYKYQFDYSILSLLKLSSGTEQITVEGIEDIDISTIACETVSQCKYYSGTDYNHSIIAPAIRFMLDDYAKNRKTTRYYKLYGFYKSGQNKLPSIINLDFLKTNLLTYTHEKKTIKTHDDLHLSDTHLEDFLQHLIIDINASDVEVQYSEILQLFKQIYSCSDFESENYYYNNALSLIIKHASRSDISERKISRSYFLEKINAKQILFNKWFYTFKGEKAVYRHLKKEHFTQLNVLPFDRIFLIEIINSCYNRSELKEILILISNKWSKLSKRTPLPFCPYVYIHNLNNNELVNIKQDFFNEGFAFLDGYPFKDSEFSAKTIVQCDNVTRLKVIDRIEFIESIIKESDKTKEIFQFYVTQPYYNFDNPSVKHIKIQNLNLSNIKEIV
jgi:hypothetical protein